MAETIISKNCLYTMVILLWIGLIFKGREYPWGSGGKKNIKGVKMYMWV